MQFLDKISQDLAPSLRGQNRCVAANALAQNQGWKQNSQEYTSIFRKDSHQQTGKMSSSLSPQYHYFLAFAQLLVSQSKNFFTFAFYHVSAGRQFLLLFHFDFLLSFVSICQPPSHVCQPPSFPRSNRRHTTMGSGGLSESWSIGAACCQRCLFSGFLLFSFTNIFTRNSVDHRCRNPPKLFLSSIWLSFVTLCFFCLAKCFHVRLKKKRIARFKNFVKKKIINLFSI